MCLARAFICCVGGWSGSSAQRVRVHSLLWRPPHGAASCQRRDGGKVLGGRGGENLREWRESESKVRDEEVWIVGAGNEHIVLFAANEQQYCPLSTLDFVHVGKCCCATGIRPACAALLRALLKTCRTGSSRFLSPSGSRGSPRRKSPARTTSRSLCCRKMNR